ncbi:MAG TPA: preprotein translocase subunit SecY [Gemmatimonadales bacterium]|nr:preprotein translocase subunit SecY [Gemmatimonadales bacterium]
MSRIGNIFKVADLRNKVLFTLFVLVLYRLGCFLPVPGVDQDAVNSIGEQAREGGVLAFLQLFSGQALTQFSFFALGIMPYITSSIIMQILTVVIPKLQEWQQQGAVGQRKITQWTRYVTIGISVLQSTGLVFLFHNGGGGLVDSTGNASSIDLVPNFTPARVLLIVTTFTAGAALLMWMGELITNRGIGNGMSLIIFCSVVSSLPAGFSAVYASGEWKLVVFAAFFILMLLAIVFIEQGQRRIPVQFAKRVVGRRMYSGQSTYIPLKVNQAGIIPIIFASAVINLPVLLSQVLPADGWGASVSKWINDNLANTINPIYLAVLGLFIIGFSYFYTAIAFDPVQQADNLRKQGGFIPGIRPGPQTESYLAKVLNRITLPGAIFVAMLAILPTILVRILLGSSGSGAAYAFGGTSLLIAVGVALETMKQVDSQLMMRNYEGFLNTK